MRDYPGSYVRVLRVCGISVISVLRLLRVVGFCVSPGFP